MTDETPQSEGEPSPATPEETPTAETKAFTYDDAVARADVGDDVAPAAEAPTQAAPAAAPAAAATAPVAAAPATADRPAGIFVPKWVGIVAALVFGGIGYAIGDASSDSGSTQNAANAVPNNGNGGQTFPGGGQFPGPGNFPNGNGNQGNGNDERPASNAGFLGVAVEPSSDPQGVKVSEVQDGSAAAKAGLQQGDVITAIDGKDVTSPQAVRSAVQAKQSGDKISVTYTRDGQSKTVDVTLTSRSQAQSS
jgi:membrane-associated protease RseP (regulator of RpoE activity)